jgi:hypothetical protein
MVQGPLPERPSILSVCSEEPRNRAHDVITIFVSAWLQAWALDTVLKSTWDFGSSDLKGGKHLRAERFAPGTYI